MLAVILARRGSKGVPHKNRALVAGRPCTAWTIDDARAAACINTIALSTDDPELQTLGVEAGIDVVVRPPALAGDTATVDDAVRHALAALPGPEPEALAILYANVPLRPAGLIDRAAAHLVAGGFDSVQSYAPAGKHHPWWTARLDPGDGAVTPWEGDTLNHGVYRRQDLPPAYVPDGGVLVVTTRALHGQLPGVPAGPHAFLGAARGGVTTREGAVVDIDTRVDLLVADALLRERAAGVMP